jgi:hypothetical protein
VNVLMRTAVEWNVIDRVPCAITMLRTPRTEAAFYEFEQFGGSSRHRLKSRKHSWSSSWEAKRVCGAGR